MSTPLLATQEAQTSCYALVLTLTKAEAALSMNKKSVFFYSPYRAITYLKKVLHLDGLMHILLAHCPTAVGHEDVIRLLTIISKIFCIFDMVVLLSLRGDMALQTHD